MGGGGGGTRYVMAGSHALKAQATKVKGELSAMAATARLLLSKRDGSTFKSVVLGFQAALDSHDDVQRRYPGHALVESATNPSFELPPQPPPSPPQSMGLGPPQALRRRSVALRTASLTIVIYNGADHCPHPAANFARTSHDFMQTREQLS